jgi:Rab-like protein 3
MNSNLEKIKIVVVGDSGVGKTSLVHLITHQEVLKKSNWTIGCSVDVKVSFVLIF